MHDPLGQALEALRLVEAHPDQAVAIASHVLSDAEVACFPEAASVAERALGLVARGRHDLVEARCRFQRAFEVAEGASLPVRAAEARTSLAFVLTLLGDTSGALRQVDLATPHLEGAAAARLLVQRAGILQRLGRLDEALDGYDRALPALRHAGDVEGEARLLSNRGVLYAYRGDFPAAEADLVAAERRHVELGQRLDAAGVHHNLGFVAARRGDVPTALRRFDHADQEFRALGARFPAVALDRCETLLAVRLVEEARAVGAAVAGELEVAGAEADLAEARLLLSQATLLGGDPAAAAALAELARHQFLSQGRSGWAAVARYAALRASWAAGVAPAATLAEAQATVDELVGSRWVVPALEARLIAGRAALAAGLLEEAIDQLRQASGARFQGPADVRARAWHAEALLRRSRGDLRGADHALQAGVAVLAHNRGVLGATELRVHAAANVADLAQLGITLALESGEAVRVLEWAERLRWGAAGLTRTPRPPADLDVANHLAELRHVVGRLEAAGFAGEDPGRLLRRQAQVEWEIRRKTRHAAGGGARSDRPAGLEDIAAGLGEWALVELVEHCGELGAVTVVDGRADLHQLGTTAETHEALDALRFALGRLARPGGSTAARRGARALAAHSAARLDGLVFGPLRRLVGERSLVLVPTGPLHAVPWATLPFCRGRPVAVSPSATRWLRASTAGDLLGGATVVVAGPRLAEAEPEARDVAAAYRDAVVLVGPEATSENVMRAVDGARLAHFAAHGRFRADNPLFSALSLIDGPLTVYDLERLEQVPRRVVLSACEIGLSAARPGEALMGLVSSLFALGSCTLVASVVAVGDATARPLMVAFHRFLTAGMGPAEALGCAQAASSREPDDAPFSAGFVCFGAG